MPLDRTRLRHVLRRIFADHGRLHGLLSIAVVGDGTIRRINRDFLAHDEPTDVITFPLDDGDGGAADDPFGEILVSAQTARREAVARGVDAPDELALYIIHGALHLAGYDDSTAAKRRRMRARERKYVGVYRKARRHGRDTEKR